MKKSPIPVFKGSRNPARKSTTLPDQALSVQTILDRYTRGIPVSLTQRESTFLDQEETDYEQLARMEFDEKIAYAQAMQQRASEIKNELAAQAQAKSERMKRKAQAKLEREIEKRGSKNSSIDQNLDNTMLRDTTHTNSNLR